MPLNLTLLKSCSIIGVFYGAMRRKQPGLHGEIIDKLFEFVASGRLRPYVSERYALDDAALALRSLLDRQAVGKIVIEP